MVGFEFSSWSNLFFLNVGSFGGSIYLHVLKIKKFLENTFSYNRSPRHGIVSYVEESEVKEKSFHNKFNNT